MLFRNEKGLPNFIEYRSESHKKRN